VRHRRRHRPSRKKLLAPYWPDALVLLSFLLTLLLLLLRLTTTGSSGWQASLDYLVLLFFALTCTGFALRLRHHARQRRRWWAGEGCPRCSEMHLKRTPRHRSDHLFGAVGIPVRRYLCGSCGWRGRRVDEQRVFF
jgi:Zn ribbon nucleic-acid-binding protein